ncbi:MAG: hypothetical protein IPL27_15490 [Lewinellaceae bacterium]|nr:hypothetical protein [Lewinellaceae bacterium]
METIAPSFNQKCGKKATAPATTIPKMPFKFRYRQSISSMAAPRGSNKAASPNLVVTAQAIRTAAATASAVRPLYTTRRPSHKAPKASASPSASDMPVSPARTK